MIFELSGFSQGTTLSSYDSIKIEKLPLGFSSHAQIKEKIKNGNEFLKTDLKDLLLLADRLTKTEPPSVINDTTAPVGIDMYDYVSYAPYWWPNPDTEDGLPYIRKDGLINHELRNKGDDKALELMAYSVHILALAYYYSEDEKYATCAQKFLSVWFLDSATKMNPNAERGQIVPGINDFGRRAGINEMRYLINVIDGVSLIADSKSWSVDKNEELKLWFFNYFQWLNESKHGKEEKIRPNNHGTWYDLQYVSIALYLDKDSLAKEQIENYSKQRINSQIDSTGIQALEVTRGFSLHYSMYNIEAFFALATLGEKVGVDLWNYKATNGGSIQKALNYLIPFVGKQSLWPYDDFGKTHEKNWFILLSTAVYKYKDEAYAKALNSEQRNKPEHCRYCYSLIVPTN